MFEGKKLREKLHAGEVCLGTWLNFTDPCVAEILSGSGFDFLIIDSEHSAQDIESVQGSIMATKGSGVAPMVRVAWNDPVLIKRVLDAGAAGVLVPQVCTAEEATQAIQACLYPPQGIRGFGPRRPANYEREFSEYINTANDNLVIWAQIEHIDAVKNIEEIVRVPRLDGVMMGPCDLSGSLGKLGQTQHPQVLEAIERTLAAAKANSVPAGMPCPSQPEAAFQWVQKGMQFITLGGDQSYLTRASHAAVSGVKKLLSPGGVAGVKDIVSPF